MTIDDFDTGDQLFFQGGLTDGDVGVTNPSFTDGVVQLSGGETEVTLTSIGSADQQIFNASQFVETFGQDALGFA
ncbi:hypothetical protein SAMN05216241_1117 [Limimonas halophila]|uniref:Uncharacterized protein n=1 Tax=Limimonas halophila TaxID=1082479 RepID=A0A1G7TYT3_9PROT|nr:hypothetical protein SAMN05216241_1117 [Limimonas halophila]